MTAPRRDARPSPFWRPATLDDVPAISAIERALHTLGSERPEVLAERIALFGEGARVLDAGGRTVGYGFAYPWRLDDAPQLDTFLGALRRDADCLFVHDVAILPENRGRGAAGTFVTYARALAGRLGLAHLALVSVYGTVPVWARHGFALRPSAGTSAQLGSYGDTARYMALLV